MTDMPTKAPFDFSTINAIKSVEDAKQWLLQFSRDFETWYAKLMDTVIGSTLAESRRYKFIESGDDLIVQYFNGTIWINTGWKLKKPA